MVVKEEIDSIRVDVIIAIYNAILANPKLLS
jgi:hypothetical protein